MVDDADMIYAMLTFRLGRPFWQSEQEFYIEKVF